MPLRDLTDVLIVTSLRNHDAVSLGEWFPTLRRNVMPSSPKVRSSKKTGFMKVTSLRSWKMSGTTVPKKRCRMPVDLNIFLPFARVSVAIGCNGKAQFDVC